MTRYSTTYEATAFPGALHGGVVTAEGLRRSISRPSEIITGAQIPTGAEIVRINNPAEYVTHERVTTPVQPQYYPPPQPGCCETISPCCYPDAGFVGGARNTINGVTTGVRNTATGAYHGVRQACPWWLWLIVGVIGLFLLAGIIWGLVVALTPAAAHAWEGTKRVASGAWEGTKNAASGAWEGAKNLGRHVGEGTRRVASGAWEGAKHVGRHVGEGTATAARGIASGLKDVADTTGNVASGAWEGAKHVGRGAGDLAANAASGVASGVKSVASTTGDVANAAWEGTKSVGRGVFEGGRSVGEGVGNALSHEQIEKLNAQGHYRRTHFRRMF